MTWELFLAYENLITLGIAVAIFLLFLIFRKLFTKYIFALLLKMTKKTKISLFSNVLVAFEKPLQWLFLIIGFYVALHYYGINVGVLLTTDFIRRIIKVAIILLAMWGFLNLSSSTSSLFHKINEKTSVHIDEILIPLLSKTLQFVIIAISLTIILQEFGYSIEGFIAGLGLGGLAISLAAKDALANFLGGIVIISEKPFTIGDWVLTPSVEGTVEDITFRSTKIRTFADALVTVPNAQLSNEPITNWSKMGKRRITYYLRLAYGTPRDKIEKIVERIETLLRNHPEIHQETIFVKFDEFNESSLDIFLYFFTKSTVWGEYLTVKEEINLKILDIVEEEGVSFAFPARRLYVEEGEMKDFQRSREHSG